MTAPALVMLASGSDDQRVTQVFHTLRHKMQTQREELSIHLAFTDNCPPTGPQVVNTLVNRGVEEICFVPLDLTHAIDAPAAMQKVMKTVRANQPKVAIELARPVGPASCLLNILDEHLRFALEQANASELDGLILSIPNSGDTRGCGLLNRRARQWSSHHKLPVQIAVGSGSTGIVPAMSALWGQGRRHIAVGSLYLAPDADFMAQAEQAIYCGAIAVSHPIGCDERILNLIMTRYAYAAMELLDIAEETDEEKTDSTESAPLEMAQTASN